MTTALSLSPLFGSAVGFDRFDSLFEKLNRGVGNPDSFPPYDIERIGEDQYEMTVSVAGFTDDEIGVTVHDNQLVVSGAKGASEPETKTFLYKGIDARSFRQVFALAPYVTVKDAGLKDGLLRVHLMREVPEDKKPRRIEIQVKDQPRAIAAPEAQTA